MDLLRQPVPSEDPQSQERRLKEECEETLHRKWSAEYVADKPRIVAPVHAELKLLHEARYDAHGEVDEEQLPEELGELQPGFVVGAYPDGLHHCDEQGQPDGE